MTQSRRCPFAGLRGGGGGGELSEERLRELFAKFDVDGSGALAADDVSGAAQQKVKDAMRLIVWHRVLWSLLPSTTFWLNGFSGLAKFGWPS